MKLLKTTDQRENDVQELCKQVLEMAPDFWDNPNGAYESSCPICRGTFKYGGGVNSPSMDELPHDQNCAYLIAKDLMTGIPVTT